MKKTNIAKFIKENKVTFKMDGDMVCATMPNFINLQESDAGFGKTEELATEDLMKTNGEVTKEFPKGKEKKQKEQKPAPAGGKDAAREEALNGGQDGMRR